MTKDLVVDINIRGMTPNDLSEPVKVAISKAACRAWSCAGQALNNAEISLLITDDWQIRKLNKRYRGIDCPTNVLSFACSCDATSQVDGAPVLLGDIVLGYGVIAREAKLHKKAFSDHICHLVVHGVLHLAGYDHESIAAAAEMRELEIYILDKNGISDPYVTWVD